MIQDEVDGLRRLEVNAARGEELRRALAGERRGEDLRRAALRADRRGRRGREQRGTGRGLKSLPRFGRLRVSRLTRLALVQVPV